VQSDSDFCGANLLPPQSPHDFGKKTLVLDLDETLIHSVFKPIENSDLIIKIPDEITDNEGNKYSMMNDIYVFKRPGVDMFLKRLSRYYELVIFTASIDKYADPVIDALDTSNLCRHRLYREHCTFMYNVFIKDLKRLGRNMEDILILDNSPISYLFQKQNALPIRTWLDDRNDIELYKYLRLLEYLAKVDDVRHIISRIVDQDTNQIDFEVFDKIFNEENSSNPSFNNLLKETHNRKQFSSETRKLVGTRFGNSNMAEPSYLANNRKHSKSKVKADKKDHFECNLLLYKARKIGSKKTSAKSPSMLNNSSKNMKKEIVDIKFNDYQIPYLTGDKEVGSILSAQYSAIHHRKTENTMTPVCNSNKSEDLYVEVVGNELKSYTVSSKKKASEKYTSASSSKPKSTSKKYPRMQRKSASSLKPITPMSVTSKRNFLINQKTNSSEMIDGKSRVQAIHRNQSAKPEQKLGKLSK
jgi:Dullard-like phosphatase family protein